MTAPSPEPTWDLPAPHILPVDVADAHIDLMRHVNNVHYLQWLENVAWDHSIAVGMAPADYARLGHGMVVRRHELDRLSLRRRYQFARASDGATLFRGTTHFVCVDIASGRVRRMPPEFTQVYARALTPA
jgi:acyl-CoA thioester hydrolase